MSIEVEVTDTFSGEANYCWVKRTTLPDGLTERQIIKRAKAFAGWTGLACRKEGHCDGIMLTPYGVCQVMFINYVD